LLSITDAVLDVPSYSAALTGYDALGLGVPVVTLPGQYMVERYALGLYKQMGLGDFAASSKSDYVDLAVRLGRDRDFRMTVSQRIQARSGVLFEDVLAVREYEEFFSSVARG
jgi:predicted O-linked N-acetylglucosamine transferase (SPINDLY family)